MVLGCVKLLQSLSQHRQHLKDLPSKTMMDILSEVTTAAHFLRGRHLFQTWDSHVHLLIVLVLLSVLFFLPKEVFVLFVRSQRRCLRRSSSVLCKLTWPQPSVVQSSSSCCWWRFSVSHNPSNPRNSRSCWAARPSSTQTTSPSKNAAIGSFVYFFVG